MIDKLEAMGINNINLINKKLNNSSLKENQYPNFNIVYAKNQVGLKKIYQLVSTSYTDSYFRTPRISIEILKNMRNDLIIANSPYDGDL
jgi:DNA polymerase-3 subunit alpha (Gram-positive type)